MSDPSQLSSEIADLDAKTANLSASGVYNGAIGSSTPAAATFTTVAESVGAGLTAVGTDRATALQLAAAINIVTGGATGTGVNLPDLHTQPGADVVVFNANASAIKVYATGSQTIDGTAGSTGVTLTNAKRCIYYMTSATAWISAQLGVTSA